MKEVPTAADPEADCFTFLPNFDTDIFFENFLVPAYVSFQALEHHVDLNLFYRYSRFSEFNQVEELLRGEFVPASRKCVCIVIDLYRMHSIMILK